jgi:hypothetical protein
LVAILKQKDIETLGEAAEGEQTCKFYHELSPDVLLAHHGGCLHRTAPGLAADRQAAYGRDSDAVFLVDREAHLGHEPGPGGQDPKVFAPGRRKKFRSITNWRNTSMSISKLPSSGNSLQPLFPIYLWQVARAGAFLYVLGCRGPLPGLHKQYIAIRWRQVLGSIMHCVAGDGVGILAGAVIAAWFQLPRPAELILEYTRFRFWLDDLPSSFHARHGWRFLQSLTAERFSA